MFDAGALDLLVLSTSAWLEVNSLRKQRRRIRPLHKPTGMHVEPTSAPEASSPYRLSTIRLPPTPPHCIRPCLAAAARQRAAAPRCCRSEAQSRQPAESRPKSEAADCVCPNRHQPTRSGRSRARQHPTSAAGCARFSPEDQEIHRKAQRFARLLVDEIKLYNQAKVAEGRKNKDLYDRLKEAIEKSRATYQKRYGNTVAASANYFQHEIIRSLAEDDLSIMGANFRQ